MKGHELEKIGRKVAVRAIPRELPVIAEGGWGAGRDCAVCDGTIGATEAEVVGHFPHHDSLTFHVRCFLQWVQIVSTTPATRRH